MDIYRAEVRLHNIQTLNVIVNIYVSERVNEWVIESAKFGAQMPNGPNGRL
jgi:hypothetical protein